MNKKIRMDTIVEIIRFAVKYSYYFCCSPFSWNEKAGMIELTKSKWRKSLWLFSTGFSLCVFFWQIYAEFTAAPTSTTEVWLGYFRRMFLLGSALGTVCQLNTVVRKIEIVDLLNKFIIRFRIIEAGGHIPSLQIYPRIVKIVVIFINVMVHFVPVGLLLISIVEFDPKGLPVFFGYPKKYKGRREEWSVSKFLIVTTTELIALYIQFNAVLVPHA